MGPLRFRYRNARGEESIRTLTEWAEHGKYIDAFEQGARSRQFLKHRVIEYLDGSETQLRDPSPPRPILPSPKAVADMRPPVLFTGFPSVQRGALERRAEAAGFRVVKSVTKDLVVLCGGPTAGPAKLHAARLGGAYILSEPELIRMCETGEIPDDEEEVV